MATAAEVGSAVIERRGDLANRLCFERANQGKSRRTGADGWKEIGGFESQKKKRHTVNEERGVAADLTVFEGICEVAVLRRAKRVAERVALVS